MKDKAEIESELAKLVDSHNKICKQYFNKKTELDSIRNEKKSLELAIDKKLEEYRKFN